MKAFILLALLLPASALTAAETVSALGRVLPRSGIVDIFGTPGETIEEIRVAEGDWVEPGQSLARLSSAQAATTRLRQAEADLAAIRVSSAKDVELSRARQAAAATEARFAQGRYERIAAAKNSEFISPDQIEDRTLGQQNAELKLAQAGQDVAQAVRDAAKAVQTAESEVAAARSALAAAGVSAPIKARVLKVRARPGAQANERTELFKLGDTSGMIVVAEIYESDVLKVKPGQKAVITSPALPARMTGTVTAVSGLVFRNTLESMDPNATTQGRVVEAVIRMDETTPLDRLVFLQVDVTISL